MGAIGDEGNVLVRTFYRSAYNQLSMHYGIVTTKSAYTNAKATRAQMTTNASRMFQKSRQ